MTAVSGSAWMSGWTASGNLEEEKNTPEKIHIGSMTTFMMPDTPSTVRGRAASSSPSEANARAESMQIPARTTSEPRTGTPNTITAKPDEQRHLDDQEGEPRQDERRQELRAGTSASP